MPGVEARVTELLPGTVFQGPRGTFTASSYTITFDIAEDGTSVEVGLNHADGFAALLRIIVESGWKAIDAVRNLPVDLDASSRHGALMLAIPATPKPPRNTMPSLFEDEPAIESATAPATVEEAPRSRSLPIRQIALGIGLVVMLSAGWAVWQWVGRVPAAEAPPAASEGKPAAPVSIRPAVDQPPALPLDAERAKIRMQQIKQLSPEFRDNAIVHQLLDYQEALAEFAASTGERRVLPPERLADRSLFPVVWPNGLLPASFQQFRRDRYVFQAVGTGCGHHGESLQDIDGFCDAIAYVARPADGGQGLSAFAFLSEDNRIHHRADDQAPTRQDPPVDNAAPPGAPGAALPAAAKATASAAAKRLTTAIESAAAAAGIRSK